MEKRAVKTRTITIEIFDKDTHDDIYVNIYEENSTGALYSVKDMDEVGKCVTKYINS